MNSPAAAVAASDSAIVAGRHTAAPSPATSTATEPDQMQDHEQPALVESMDAGQARRAVEAGIAEMGGEDDVVPTTVDLPPRELRGVLEALLLASSKPLTLQRLVKLLPGANADYLDGFLHGLADRFGDERRGWELRRHAGGWQLLTRPDYHPWVRQLDRKELPTRLSRSAMETLAIVAYKQPVTRGAIEDIRGVQSGPMLRLLMDLKLAKVVGRDDHALGQPLLYGTTEQFLDRFGLGSPDDLPRGHELGA